MVRGLIFAAGVLVGIAAGIGGSWFYFTRYDSRAQVEVKRESILDPADGISITARRSASPTEKNPSAKISISDDLISELETQQERLKKILYAEAAPEGWKLHFIKNDELLGKLGLHDGDVITYESLDTERSKPKRFRLANRMVDVLNFLKR